MSLNRNRIIQRYFIPNNRFDEFQGGEIERAKNYISIYHPDLLNLFEETEISSKGIKLDEWLKSNININMEGIDESQRQMDKEKRTERHYRRDDAIIPPPSVNLFYGEEDGSGALATIRANPLLTRFGNRSIMTTNRSHFPDDERTQRNIKEFIERGGEVSTGIDVTNSIYDDNSGVPFNVSNLTFHFPRNNRGTNPSTARITSEFVNRASEAGQGILTLPSSETYGGNSQVARRLYGGRQFENTMEQTGMYIAEVGPGPESELSLFGYTHRRTGETESIKNLKGSTMTLKHGNGKRSFADYYNQ